MNTLSPFIGSIVRHLLTALAGVLVAKGYIDQQVATQAVEANSAIITGLVLYWIAQGWSFKQKQLK